MRAIVSFIVTIVGVVLMFIGVFVILAGLVGLGLACLVLDIAERIGSQRQRLLVRR